MRITLRNPGGFTYSIDTFSPQIAAEWLAEWLPRMQGRSDHYPWEIQVWAHSKEEHERFGKTAMVREDATDDGFVKLENFFRRASGRDKGRKR